MSQKEMKVLKFPSRHQRYYISFMESFGWEVQEFHEMVDQTYTYSSGSTTNNSYGSFHGNVQHYRGSNMSHLSGRSSNYGHSYNSGSEITQVTTSFTVTFVRDRDIPHKAELERIEQSFHNLTPAYFKRLNKIHIFFKDVPQNQWPEWQAIQACANDARAVRRRPVQQSPTRQVAAPQKSVQKPAVSAPPPAISKPTKTVAKPTPKPIKKAPPATVVERQSFEEYAEGFCKNRNWDENTKGKDEFLKGLKCWYANYSDKNALKYFKQAVEINPKEPVFWEWFAKPEYYQNKYQKSIEVYHQALKELPDNQQILSTLIYIYIRAEEINNAEEYLAILKKNVTDEDLPLQVSIIRLTGQIHEAKVEYKEAMQLYNKADKLVDPEKDFFVGIYQQNLKNKMKKS